MSANQDKNQEKLQELSSDLSSDEEFTDTNEYIKEKKKIYQVQFDKDDLYLLKWVGYSETLPTISLTDFKNEGNSYFVESNFSYFDESHTSGTCLFDMITLNVIQSDCIEYKLILSVELTDVKLDKENKGNLMIWFEKDGKRLPLKTNLTHPGNEKVQYYIFAELKNDKIKELIKL